MLEQVIGGQFEYKKLTEAEQKSRGILGRLIGVIADTKDPTRNGRKYSLKLWENVFKDPIMQEKIANRCCFGELNHPADRTETDIEKVAICLAEQPKKGKDGKLYGVFDILSTPNGRILKALCDYGCKIGISSRGQGDIITDEDGNEAVDPDTYDCECFDAVLVPGVETARLKYVKEDFKKSELKASLTESFQKANAKERKIMRETLKNLNINLQEEDEENKNDVKKEQSKSNSKDKSLKTDKVDAEKIDVDTDMNIDNKSLVTNDSDSNQIDDMVDVELSDLFDDEDNIDNDQDDSENIDQEEDDFNLDIDDITFDDELEDETKTDERTDEEIFLDFLANNFDEDKIKKVCKILDIEEVEDSEDDESEDETEDDSDKSEEETDIEIDADEEEDNKASTSDDESDDNIDDSEKDETADSDENMKEAKDFRSNMLVKSLKEAVKEKSDLENMIRGLQEKLAVSDAKVNELNEECNRYKSAVARLSMLAKLGKDLKENVSKLEESLSEKDEIIDAQKTRISRLVKSRKENLNNSNSLTESVNRKDNQISKLTENIRNNKVKYEDNIKSLTEQLDKLSGESANKINQLNENLQKITTIKESYRKLANKAVNKYIDVKAEVLGLTSIDIKRKLGESYTMEDVDQVCEDLKSYQLNVSKLPFSIDKKISVKVNQPTAGRNLTSNKSISDDDVDDTLIKLANVGF